MIKIIQEGTQLIHVSKDSELTQGVIKYALYSAMCSRRYAKFYSSRYYIEVTFHRDGTTRIASNYKTNTTFNRQLNQIDNRKFELGACTNFIWLWMNRIRKL